MYTYCLTRVLNPFIVLVTLQSWLSIHSFTLREVTVSGDTDDYFTDISARIPRDPFSTKVILDEESFAKERSLILPLVNRLDEDFTRAMTILNIPRNPTSNLFISNFLLKAYWPHRDDTIVLLAVKFDPKLKSSLLFTTLRPFNAMFFVLFERWTSSLIVYKVCFTCNLVKPLVATPVTQIFTDWQKTKETLVRNLNGFQVAILDRRSPSIYSKIPCKVLPIHRYTGKEINSYCQPQYLVTDALAKHYNLTPVIYPLRYRDDPDIPSTAMLTGGAYFLRVPYKTRVFVHNKIRQRFVFCRNIGENWSKRKNTVVSILLSPFDSKCWNLILVSFILTILILPMKISAVDRLFMATKILLRQSILLSQKAQVKCFLLLIVLMAVILTSAYEGGISSMNISPEKENIGLETFKEMILLRGYKIFLRSFAIGHDEELKKQFLTTFQAQGLTSHWNSSFHIQVFVNATHGSDIIGTLANETSKFMVLTQNNLIESLFLLTRYTNPNRTCYKMIEQLVTSSRAWLLQNRFNWIFLKSLNRLQETGLLDMFYAVENFLIHLADESNRRNIPEEMRLFKTPSYSTFLKKNSIHLLLRPILIASSGYCVVFLIELLYFKIHIKVCN